MPGRAPHGVLRRLPKAAESVRLWWAREEISGLQRGVLALCLTAGLLCGCGGGSNAVTGSPSSPATSAQSSDSAADQSMAEKTVGRLSDLTSRWQVLLPRDDPIVAAEMACVRSVGRGGLTAEHAGDLFSSGDPTVLVGGTREDAASAFTAAEGFVRSRSAAQCLMRAMQTSNGLPGKVTVYVDTVLILQERGVGEAVLSSVSVPPFYGPLTSDDVRYWSGVVADRIAHGWRPA